MAGNYDKLTAALNGTNKAREVSESITEDETSAIEANNLAVEEMVLGFDKKFAGLRAQLGTTRETLAVDTSEEKQEIEVGTKYDALLDNLQSYYDEKLIVVGENESKVLALTSSYEDLKAELLLTKNEELAVVSAAQEESILEASAEMFDAHYGSLVSVVGSSLEKFTDKIASSSFDIKAAFKELVDSLIQDLVRLALKQVVVDNLMGGFESMLGKPGGDSGGGFLGGLLGGLVGGAKSMLGFAEGGVINEPVVGVGTKSGSGYTIGEEGPEAIVPLKNAGGGNVKNAGGGGNVVNINISAVDSKSLTELMANNPGAITGPIVNALNNGDRGLSMALKGAVV
jgi:hypothetical protein